MSSLEQMLGLRDDSLDPGMTNSGMDCGVTMLAVNLSGVPSGGLRVLWKGGGEPALGHPATPSAPSWSPWPWPLSRLPVAPGQQSQQQPGIKLSDCCSLISHFCKKCKLIKMCLDVSRTCTGYEYGRGHKPPINT